MSLSRLPLPSFSIVLTRPDESGASVELLHLRDFKRASRRELHLNLQPSNDDPLMKTVDTRFTGSLAYNVDYADEKKETYCPTARSSSTPSSLCSIAESEDEDDAASTASSTSTNEVDLNSEFANDTDAATLSGCDVGELGEANPPLHLRRSPFVEPPCHECEAGGIPLHGLGSGPPNYYGHSQRASERGMDAFARLWLSILKMLRSLWRRLKRTGALIVHECTKDL